VISVKSLSQDSHWNHLGIFHCKNGIKPGNTQGHDQSHPSLVRAGFFMLFQKNSSKEKKSKFLPKTQGFSLKTLVFRYSLPPKAFKKVGFKAYKRPKVRRCKMQQVLVR